MAAGSPRQIWHGIQHRPGRRCSWATSKQATCGTKQFDLANLFNKRQAREKLFRHALTRHACRSVPGQTIFEPLFSCSSLVEQDCQVKLFGSTCSLLPGCPRASSARTVMDAVPNLLGATRCQTESGKLAALVAKFVYSSGVP